METNLVMGKGQQNKVMKIENILEKSWNFSTADHESHTRSSNKSICIQYNTIELYCPVKFNVGRSKINFLTSYFQFEEEFDFLFV